MPLPSHRPTPESRAKVETLAGVGTPHEHISGMVGITEKTLRKHYKSELAFGAAKATAGVAGELYRTAMGPPGQGKAAAMIFWLKTRGGWKETSVHEVTGKDKGPLQFVISESDANL